MFTTLDGSSISSPAGALTRRFFFYPPGTLTLPPTSLVLPPSTPTTRAHTRSHEARSMPASRPRHCCLCVCVRLQRVVCDSAGVRWGGGRYISPSGPSGLVTPATSHILLPLPKVNKILAVILIYFQKDANMREATCCRCRRCRRRRRLHWPPFQWDVFGFHRGRLTNVSLGSFVTQYGNKKWRRILLCRSPRCLLPLSNW